MLGWLPLSAAVQVNALFSDHAVLQRGKPIPVWGLAAPGEKIKAEFGGQTQSTTTAPDGKWSVTFSPLEASSESRVLTIQGDQSPAPLLVQDVLVGEVWFCGGQSNMEWALNKSTGGPEAIAASSNPLLRLCTVHHNSQMEPQDDWKPSQHVLMPGQKPSPNDSEPKWVLSAPNSTPFFSAVGYWFGSKLQKELGVPVGLINGAYGGTPLQAWMPLESLKNGPWPQDNTTNIEQAKALYDQRLAKSMPLMEKYAAEKAEALKNKLPAPTMPAGWPGDFRGPSVLWNGMIHPLLKLAIRGVAWYQGENNAYVGWGKTYAQCLPVFLAEWRSAFGQPDLPFLIFQIAPNRKPQVDPNEPSGVAEIQEGQFKTVRTTPNTALVITMDQGEPDVHYKNKEPIGERAMKAALDLVYGKPTEYSGPLYQSMEVKDHQVILHFDHLGGGLQAQGDSLTGFVIAGADKKFVFAEARIEGETIVVSSPQVPQPLAVRYGWADLPKVNLFNKAGHPASPFRTDDWPLPNPNAKPETSTP
jgi:sialate O-acetylesterase